MLQHTISLVTRIRNLKQLPLQLIEAILLQPYSQVYSMLFGCSRYLPSLGWHRVPVLHSIVARLIRWRSKDACRQPNERQYRNPQLHCSQENGERS